MARMASCMVKHGEIGIAWLEGQGLSVGCEQMVASHECRGRPQPFRCSLASRWHAASHGATKKDGHFGHAKPP